MNKVFQGPWVKAFSLLTFTQRQPLKKYAMFFMPLISVFYNESLKKLDNLVRR